MSKVEHYQTKSVVNMDAALNKARALSFETENIPLLRRRLKESSEAYRKQLAVLVGVCRFDNFIRYGVAPKVGTKAIIEAMKKLQYEPSKRPRRDK